MPEIETLEPQAVTAALSKDWKKAVELNKQIIDYDDQNVPALNRLAKAYLELEKYDEAKKTLKHVLKLDPINQTAKKNFEYASAHRKVLGNLPHPDLKNYIKEPGTTKEFAFSIMTKGLTAKKFFQGEPLDIQHDKHKVSVHKLSGELIGIFDSINAEKILFCIKRGGTVKASFTSGEEKELKVLIKSSIPIFSSEKQETKPYIKRETLEEPELEMTPPETEE